MTTPTRRDALAGLAATGFALSAPRLAAAQTGRTWAEVLAKARGRTVFWNAWAGDERTNSFIAWAGGEAKRRHGVEIRHVKLRDTAEAVTRVLAEKAAGRAEGGSVDLIWINGPNFLAMKENGLLYGPFAEGLPNFRFVDTVNKRSNVVDFTVPVEGYASPWRLARVVFVHDEARTKLADLPRSVPAMLDWARANPGRLTHPNIRNFLGATFLKQALYELAPDAEVLSSPANEASFATTAAPLWGWYAALRPHLWRAGREFPETGAAQLQLLADGEVDLHISFNPAEAAVAIASGALPPTARAFGLTRGTIGNTSFVVIPFNAASPEAAMVVADLLIEPATQARAQSPDSMGSLTVLDLGKLPEAERAAFALKASPAIPTPELLGPLLPEPHPTWMTRLTAEWERRVLR